MKILLIICIASCCIFSSSANVNYQYYSEQCQLSIPSHLYKNFQAITTHSSTKVMYLDVVNASNQPLYPPDENVKLAWIKLDFGQSLMILPVDFTVMSAFLPYFFFNRMTLVMAEKPNNCFSDLPDEARDTLVFTALRKFAHINLNCIGSNCETICKRIIDPSTPLDDITFSCCRMVNFTEVCRIPYKTSSSIIAFRYVSIVLSIMLSAALIKWLLRDVPEIEATHQIETPKGYDYIDLRLVSNYKSEDSGEGFKRLLHGSVISSTLWLRCLDLFVLVIVGCGISVWVQTFPYFLVPYPTIYDTPFPWPIVLSFLTFAGVYALLTIIIILPIFHCGKKEFENSLRYKNQSVIKYSEKEYAFRLLWYMDKLFSYIAHLVTGNIFDLHLWWKIVSTLIIAILCSPFALIDKLSLQYYAFRKADIFTCILCDRFHCSGYKLSHPKALLKAIIYIISVGYCVISVIGIWASIQVFVRILITSTAFIMSHSNFFSSYLAIGFPFIYFIKQVFESYSAEKMTLSQIIFEVREDVENEIDEFLSSDEGKFDIRFIVSDKGVQVDLPVRLENLRDFITQKMELLTYEYDTDLRFEEQTIIVIYKLSKADDEGHKNYDIVFSRFNSYLHDLRLKINEELSQQNKAELQEQLIQVYYDIKDEFTNEGDVGVPMEIYNYIAYQAPKISTSSWQMFGRILTIALIGVCFVLAVASFYNIDRINALSDALSGTILSYITMVASMSYVASGGIEEHKRRMLVKKHILDYICGYRFFYTRGNTFNPCTQLYQSLHWYKLLKKSKESSSDVA
ncbi:hypothetical protein TrispH2_004921 [Trichoplax sp. H2]|nr:hypothetical protein TrispH2_004921 [Trichoplax sp. H2]|eukprot:RDD42949.1 hypothetical protein TrispH2_004921 [Trichoplax sp. H2]